MSEFSVRDHALTTRDHDKKIGSRVKIKADSDKINRENASGGSQNPKKYAQKCPTKPEFDHVKRTACDHEPRGMITLSWGMITCPEGVITHPEHVITRPKCVSTHFEGQK